MISNQSKYLFKLLFAIDCNLVQYIKVSPKESFGGFYASRKEIFDSIRMIFCNIGDAVIVSTMV